MPSRIGSGRGFTGVTGEKGESTKESRWESKPSLPEGTRSQKPGDQVDKKEHDDNEVPGTTNEEEIDRTTEVRNLDDPSEAEDARRGFKIFT